MGDVGVVAGNGWQTYGRMDGWAGEWMLSVVLPIMLMMVMVNEMMMLMMIMMILKMMMMHHVM